jgi:hypothetical protein
LTCDFWAENAENNCKRNKQKQIHFGILFGDDNQKGNGDGISSFAAACGMRFIGGAGVVNDERKGR